MALFVYLHVLNMITEGEAVNADASWQQWMAQRLLLQLK